MDGYGGDSMAKVLPLHLLWRQVSTGRQRGGNRNVMMARGTFANILF